MYAVNSDHRGRSDGESETNGQHGHGNLCWRYVDVEGVMSIPTINQISWSRALASSHPSLSYASRWHPGTSALASKKSAGQIWMQVGLHTFPPGSNWRLHVWSHERLRNSLQARSVLGC